MSMSSNALLLRRPASFKTLLMLLASLRYTTMYSAQMVYKNTILNKCYIAQERQLLDNKIAVSGFLHNIYTLTMSIARGTSIFISFFGEKEVN